MKDDTQMEEFQKGGEDIYVSYLRKNSKVQTSFFYNPAVIEES